MALINQLTQFKDIPMQPWVIIKTPLYTKVK